MPLFKKREPEREPVSDSSASFTDVLTEPGIRDRLDEEGWRAARYGRPLAVLCITPDLLPAESLPPAESERAANVVRAEMRRSDRVGTLADGTLIVVLPETGAVPATTIASRLAADLSRRVFADTRRNWRVGIANCPADGQDEAALINAAVASAIAPRHTNKG